MLAVGLSLATCCNCSWEPVAEVTSEAAENMAQAEWGQAGGRIGVVYLAG